MFHRAGGDDDDHYPRLPSSNRHRRVQPRLVLVPVSYQHDRGRNNPPFGNLLFVLKATALETPLEEVYRAAVPFVFIVLFCMILLVLFPQIALWLPNLMVR